MENQVSEFLNRIESLRAEIVYDIIPTERLIYSMFSMSAKPYHIYNIILFHTICEINPNLSVDEIYKLFRKEYLDCGMTHDRGIIESDEFDGLHEPMKREFRSCLMIAQGNNNNDNEYK